MADADGSQGVQRTATQVPVRLLVLMDTTIISGPLRQLVASLEDLVAHGVTAHVLLTTRTGRNARDVLAFLTAHGIAHTHVEASRRFDRHALQAYRDALRTGRYNALQTHGYRATVMGYLLQHPMPSRVPWVAFFHGRTSESLAVRLFDRLGIWCAHAADRIVVVADRHRAYFKRARTRTVHLPNAILALPPTSYASDDCAPRVPERIVCIGRLSPEKGVDVLLEAVALLRAEGQQAPVVIVGDGPERARLEARAQALRLDAVEFVGHVPDASSYYTSGSLVCIPSRSEGMPNVLLEAVAAGVPVVATAVGDIPLMLDDPALGTCVPAENSARLADALRHALAPSAHASAPAYHAARARLLTRFSRTQRAEQLQALYAQVLQSGR